MKQMQYELFSVCKAILNALIVSLSILKRKYPAMFKPKASFRRRTFHAPNRMQMNLNKDFSLLKLGSANEKFDVCNGPEVSKSCSLSSCTIENNQMLQFHLSNYFRIE